MSEKAPRRKPAKKAKASGKDHGATIILTPKQEGTLEALIGMGLSLEACALELGISKATLERRIVDTPEIREVVRRGRVRAEARVVQTAYQMATGTKNRKADPRMTRYWLNCRAGWKEREGIQIQNLYNKEAIDVTPQQRFVKKLETMSPDEVRKMLEKKTPIIDS